MSPSINYYCVSLTQRALYFMGKMVPNEGDGTLQIQYYIGNATNFDK